jgi:hypothetical protein
MLGTLRYQDKYGHYSIWTDDQILFCIVHGVIGETVAKHFDRHFCQLAESLAAKPWAYCADLSACDGYTKEAAECIKGSHKFGITRGCIMDAYQMSSPLLISQSQKFREALGITGHISERIFKNDKGCMDFLLSALKTDNNYI